MRIEEPTLRRVAHRVEAHGFEITLPSKSWEKSARPRYIVDFYQKFPTMLTSVVGWNGRSRKLTLPSARLNRRAAGLRSSPPASRCASTTTGKSDHGGVRHGRMAAQTGSDRFRHHLEPTARNGAVIAAQTRALRGTRRNQ